MEVSSEGPSRRPGGESPTSRKPILLPGIVGLAGALLLFVELRHGVPRANDFADHAGTTVQVLNAFRDGVFYPRWMPDFHAGLGEPTLNFYPPGLYLVSALLAWLLGGDVLAGLFATLFLLAVAGGIGMFVFLRRPQGTGAAVIGGLAFGILPYRFFEIYCAGLYSAFCAACLLPWALHLLGRIASLEERGRFGVCLAWAAVYAAIVFTNLPTAVLLAYFSLFYFLLELIAGRAPRRLLGIPAGGLWGIGLAALYLLPAVLELRWLQAFPGAGLNLYRSNFLFQFAGSWMGPGLRKMFAGMAIFPALALVISLAAIAAARRRHSAPEDPEMPWVRLVALVGLLSLFLATPVSSWLWSVLPYLKEVNLPWRLLEPLGTAAVAASAAAWVLLRRRRSSRVLSGSLATFLLLLAAVCVSFDLSLSRVNGRAAWAETEAALPTFARKTPQGLFLLKGARPPAEFSNVPLVACGSPCRVAIRAWLPSHREIWVDAPGGTALALRTYFFPGWTARRADGRQEPFPVGAEAGTGRLVVRLPEGESHVLIK
ncbi:MAG TPA: hypothetical protein VKE50_01585, partial [Thermoanaerobaculia bacterium]|nr:hypothetical protein [Thermoanaerobaculia bacterium]